MSNKTLRNMRLTAGGLALCLFAAALTTLAANYPPWWSSRGVLNTQVVTNDYAGVNAGQLKWFAAKAREEFDARLPGGAGPNISAMIAAFSMTSNYCGVNVGQLKYVATPFYDRIGEIAVLYPDITNAYPPGMTPPYPWSTNRNDDNDFAAVNVGQVKYVFSLDVANDVDADSLPDWWEMRWFGHLLCSGTDDGDLDYVSNADEYLRGLSPVAEDSDGDGLPDGAEIYIHGTNPGNPDTDGDGIDDGWEASHGLNPMASDAEQDPDFDGLPSLQEYMIGTHPNNYDTDGDGLSDGGDLALGCNPLDSDTDKDKLTDGYEVQTSGTDPLDSDSDDDGTTDGAEYLDCPQSGPIGPDPGHPHVVTFDCDAVEIQPPGLPNNAKFGYAVAVSEDDFAVIGSPGANRAYFYHGSPNVCGARDPGEWTLQGITSDDGVASLGSAVAICRNDWGQHIAVIGAPESQMAMLYIEDNGIWTSRPPLGWGPVVPSFGQALAMTSARIVVGAPYADPTYGQVYIYDIGGNLEQVLTGAPGFGSSLDIDREYGSDLIVVGNPVAGTVVPYRLRNGTWQADMDLPFPPIPSFGTSVAIVGFMDGEYRKRIYVGMPDFGEVHMFGSVNLDPFWMPEGVVSGSTLDSALGFGSVLAKRDSPSWGGEGDVNSVFVGATDLIAPGKGDVPLLTESVAAVGGAKRLVNPSPDEPSNFGCAVAGSMYRVLAGARNADGKGAVYAYSLRGWFLGDMNDQFYWKSTVARTCMVQTNEVFSGDAALKILPWETPATLYRDTWALEGPPGAAYPAKIWSQWIDYHTIPARCAADDRPTLDPQCPVGLYFDEAGSPVVFTRFFDLELGQEREDWTVVGYPVPPNAWLRITIEVFYGDEYGQATPYWDLWINGVLVARVDFPSFFTPESGWSEFERRWCFYGSKRASTYIDQLSISLDEPPGFRDDFNGNGLPDSWEAGYGLVSSDPDYDSDGDGLTSLMEYASGTSPIDADTDGDGMPDDFETLTGLSPLIGCGDDGAFGDPDNDALCNLDEYRSITSPMNARSPCSGGALDSEYVTTQLGLPGASLKVESQCGAHYYGTSFISAGNGSTYGHLSTMTSCGEGDAVGGAMSPVYDNAFSRKGKGQETYTLVTRNANVLTWVVDTWDQSDPNMVDVDMLPANNRITLYRGRWTHDSDVFGTPQPAAGSGIASSSCSPSPLTKEGAETLTWTFKGFAQPPPESIYGAYCGGYAVLSAKWTHKLPSLRIQPRNKVAAPGSADIVYSLENPADNPCYAGNVIWTIQPIVDDGARFVDGSSLLTTITTSGGAAPSIRPGTKVNVYTVFAEAGPDPHVLHDQTKLIVPSVEFASLAFTSDHGVLKHNVSDFLDTATDYPTGPEWDPSRSIHPNVPITHSMGIKVTTTLTLNVSPTGVSIPYTLSGDGPGTHLDFTKSGSLNGGINSITMTSVGNVPDGISPNAGGTISWTLTLGEAYSTSQDTGPHKMYVTASTPYGSVVTDKRMEWATITCGTLTTGHDCAEVIHSSCGTYVLGSAPPTPIWLIADGSSAECHMLSAFYKAGMEILGWPPGNIVYLYPKLGFGSKETDSGFDNETWNGYKMIFVDGSGGKNNFEGSYKYTEDGVVKYYAGGAGVYASPQECMEAICDKTYWFHWFWGLTPAENWP